MNDRFIFNVCAFIGMIVTLLMIVSFLKEFGVHIGTKTMIMMIWIIISFSWFADVFLRIFSYILLAKSMSYPWTWSHNRENLSYLVKEDLKEFHKGEIVTVVIVVMLGYGLMNAILSPYVKKIGTGLHLATWSFAALWLGGLIIGGFLYVIFKSCSDSES